MWNETERERVKQLLRSGRSVRGVARAMRIERAIAAGRIHRDPELAGLVGQRRPGAITQPRLAASPPELMVSPLVIDRPLHGLPVGAAHLADLGADQCRWSIGHDRQGHVFCGRPIGAHRAYCPCHASMARGTGA
jgi:hypothetical protein